MLNEWEYEEVKEYFHYTNLDGLMGILSTKTIRLCSYRGMNDNMELQWFQKKLKLQLEKAIKEKGLESTHTPILHKLYSLSLIHI
ncbi:hypothetical protein CTM75_19990 [Photobacterium phosphoreum]|nr:hypothetical protein CTM75_19990 [Photobacterium phosphoreum]